MNQPTPTATSWPKLRLDFHDTAVIMSQWKQNGQLLTYPVSINDVVSACSNVTLGSGLLPPKTLFWQQQANKMTLGIYVPARRWRVQTIERAYHLPLPPFVFVGSGSSYRVFAVKQRPESEQDRLYHAPCPNVGGDGGICQGETLFPVCSPQTIHKAFQLFMEGSLFNSHMSRGKCHSQEEDVRQLWAALDGHKRFPLSELVQMNLRLQNLL